MMRKRWKKQTAAWLLAGMMFAASAQAVCADEDYVDMDEADIEAFLENADEEWFEEETAQVGEGETQEGAEENSGDVEFFEATPFDPENAITYSDEYVYAKAVPELATTLPAGTQLKVRILTPETAGYNRDAYYGAVSAAGEGVTSTADNTLLFDVAFLVHKTDDEGNWLVREDDGESSSIFDLKADGVVYEMREVQPEGPVQIAISFTADELNTIHLENGDAAAVTALPLSQGAGADHEAISAEDVHAEPVYDAWVGTDGSEEASFTAYSSTVYAIRNTEAPAVENIEDAAEPLTPEEGAENIEDAAEPLVPESEAGNIEDVELIDDAAEPLTPESGEVIDVEDISNQSVEATAEEIAAAIPEATPEGTIAGETLQLLEEWVDSEPEPTEEPTPEPTEEPTPEPTEAPTPEPTEAPTPEPTEEPTPEPTEAPTPEPTEAPTPEPTEEPTPEPTEEPTSEPTEAPAAEPVTEEELAAFLKSLPEDEAKEFSDMTEDELAGWLKELPEETTAGVTEMSEEELLAWLDELPRVDDAPAPTAPAEEAPAETVEQAEPAGTGETAPEQPADVTTVSPTPVENGNKEGAAEIYVNLNLVGRSIEEDDNFTFRLLADTSTASDGSTVATPMPAGQSVTAVNSEAISFGEIHFSKPGTYNYKVIEDVPGGASFNSSGQFEKDGVTYDSTQHKVQIKVAETGSDKLTATVFYDDLETGTLTFTNTYAANTETISSREITPTEIQSSSAETKEAGKAAPARSMTLYIALLAIGAIALVILLVLMRLRK